MIIEKYKHRLYGRTRGRSKRKINIEDYSKKISKYKLEKLISSEKYILDIGTGYGETSIYLAKTYSNFKIISCEKYIDGNLKLISKINDKKINNIILHPGNVYEILDLNYSQKYFHKVWIFFPDPWPKKKHFKRRLINRDFLKKLYPFIVNDGEICITTDSSSYLRSILNSIFELKDHYLWKNQSKLHLDINDYYELETKYYKKAINSGRKPSILILKKL